MRYASVCSGVGTCALAWNPFGWESGWFSEIAPFPSAVLAHRFPKVPNHGDMLGVLARLRDMESGEAARDHALYDIDMLAGGTPCQAFSTAGKRASLDDARGNLSLSFCEIADAIDRLRPGGLPLVCWENVPGVLNTKDNAYGCFLGRLCGLNAALLPPRGVHKRGWRSGGRFSWPGAGVVVGPSRAIAWRIIDARFTGVPQRRRRVIVVACSRTSGLSPSEILHDWGSSAGSAEAGGTTGAQAATDPAGGIARCGEDGLGGAAYCLTAHHGRANHEEVMVPERVCVTGDCTHALKAAGADGSEDGTGRGQPIVNDAPPQVPFIIRPQGSCDRERHAAETDTARCLDTNGAGGHGNQGGTVVVERQPFQCHGNNVGPMGTLRKGNGNVTAGVPFVVDEPVPFDLTQITSDENRSNPQPGAPPARGMAHQAPPAIAYRTFVAGGAYEEGDCTGAMADPSQRVLVDPSQRWAVRRLTPRECERLQEIPDDHTLVPVGKKGTPAKDSPRYCAIGNSWARSVFYWLGTRINAALAAHA